VDSLEIDFKNTLRSMPLLSTVLWSTGALFAVWLALVLSGVVVLFMVCLFRLADPSEKWDGDVVGRVLLLRERKAQKGVEFWPESDADVGGGRICQVNTASLLSGYMKN
jgi:hypothetical protein